MLARKLKPHSQNALPERTVARKVVSKGTLPAALWKCNMDAQNVKIVRPGPIATHINARHVQEHVVLRIGTTPALTIAIHMAAQVAH